MNTQHYTAFPDIMALQALDLAHSEAICPEEIHDLFVARAEVYAELQQPRMAFLDHLQAAKVCKHEQTLRQMQVHQLVPQGAVTVALFSKILLLMLSKPLYETLLVYMLPACSLMLIQLLGFKAITA